MNLEFNDLEWHDAELLHILIVREPEDCVEICIRWPGSENTSIERLQFYDCYGFQADMHFGICPPDSIMSAHCCSDSEQLQTIRNKWNKIDLDLKNLLHFNIQTNSTNSSIHIFAKEFKRF